MARKHLEMNGGGTGKSRSVKYPSTMYFNTISPPSSIKGEKPRLSSTGATTPTNSQKSSPRTSPGLLAGHYAGCKWTEPPLPSALPLPPQHWVQTQSLSVHICAKQPDVSDISKQLKVLLNVQA